MLPEAISSLATILLLLATSTIAVPHKGFTNGSILRKLPDKSIVPTTQSFRDKMVCEINPIPGDMRYLGGRLMTGQINIYYIFYGSWQEAQKGILIDFANTIGGSNYSNILLMYGASSNINYVRSINDNYSQGSQVSEDGIITIVENAIHNGDFPYDTNGIYFVLTSPDVDVGAGGSSAAFCDGYCGYHAAEPGRNTTYAFVGNSARCMEHCGRCSQKASPNDDPGVDAMVSHVANVMIGAISDPQFDGLLDEFYFEIGAKCIFNYGETQTLPNGALYNLVLQQRKYLVQQMWNGKVRGCAMSG